MKNKRKVLFPFLFAISVIALLLAGCPPTNGGGGDTAPQYKNIQLVGKTIEIIFDKDLKALPDAVKITVKQGKNTLTYKTNYDLSISNTDKKKLIITLKQSPTGGQTYTVILKAGAVTGANGKAAKAAQAETVIPIANTPPVLLSSGNLGFQTNSSTVLTLSFDTALKSLDTDKIQVQAKAATAGAEFGDVSAAPKLRTADKTKIDITLKSPATSGNSYQVLVAIGGVVSANNVANSANLNSVVVEYSDKPVLDTINPPYMLGKKIIATFNMNIDLLATEKVKLSKAVDAAAVTAGTFSTLTPESVKVGENKNNTLEITLPTSDNVAVENVYRLALEAGAVNKVGKADITNLDITPTDITIVVAPALDGSPYILGKRIIATFNMNIAVVAAGKVKLSKAVDAVAVTAGTFSTLTPESVKVGENKNNTLEITLPTEDTMAAGNVYRLALEAGAVNKAGKADITNLDITPTNLDITILAAPALDGSQAPYMVGDKIYVIFNSPIPGLDTSKKIGVEVSTDDGDSFESSDALDADPTHSGSVLALTLDSRDQGNTYKVTLPTGLILGRNTLLTRNIEFNIKATTRPTLVPVARPVFQSDTTFHIIFNANVNLLNTDAIEVRKDDTKVAVQSLAANGGTVMVTLNEGATANSKWKVVFPVGTVLDTTSRNANPRPITTAEGTFITEKYKPTNKAELKTAISTEQDKGEASDFSTDKFDISQVSDMSGLFEGNTSFNGDISSWYVSHVTNMSNMFKGATAFNQALQNWNVDGDTVDIKEMFKDSGVEPAKIPTWYIKITPSLPKLYVLESDGKITDFTFTKQPANMTGSFAIEPRSLPNGLSFSSTTGTISGIPTEPDSLPDPNDFYGKDTYTITFTGSEGFTGSKYTLTKELDIGVYKYRPTTKATLVANIETEIGLQGQTANLNNIDVSRVKDLSKVFYRKNEFNGDVSKWDTSKVTNMDSMFALTGFFNRDISGWDVSQVTNMKFMFGVAKAFNNGELPLNWGTKVGKVTSMSNMFKDAKAFNQDISGWDVSKVTDMQYMFTSADEFNNGGQALNWGTKTGQVTNMRNMFSGASNFNQDISSWDVSKVTTMRRIFAFAVEFDNGGQALDWGTKTGQVTNMGSMFLGVKAFNQDISGWDVSKVTNMRIMFARAIAFNQDISGWAVGKVTDMEDMFNGATAFSHNLEAWGTHLSGRTVTKTNVFKDSGVTQENKPSWYTWHTRRK